MSLVYMDGFEDFTSGLPGRVVGIGIGGGRNGNGGLLQKQQVSYFDIPAASQHATLIVGIAFMATARWGGGQDNPLLAFYGDAGTTQHMYLGSDGVTVYLWRGATLLGSAPAGHPPGQWGYYEVKVTLSDTVGVGQVRFNGVQVINFSGDTKNGGTGLVFDRMWIAGGVFQQFNQGDALSVDDLYLLNGAGSAPMNNFLGDISVDGMLPNGNGSASGMTGSDGNSVDNYLLVDDPTASLADYVQSAVTGTRDLYPATDPPHTNPIVYGVMLTSYAQNADSGPQTIKLPVKSGATIDSGPGFTVVTTPSAPWRTLENNPATGAAWTYAEITAAEIGAEVGG